MEFDRDTQRIFLSIDERQVLDKTEFFGGLPIEGLPLLQAQVAGKLAVGQAIERQRSGKTSVELFALRRQRNILEQMTAEFPIIQKFIWGELFEEPPTPYDELD